MSFDIILSLGRLLRGDIGGHTFPITEPEPIPIAGRAGPYLPCQMNAVAVVRLPAMVAGERRPLLLIDLGRVLYPGDFDCHEDD